MNTSSELHVLVEELAAHWTEPTLEILASAGLRKISVDMELKTWRTLTSVLHHELRRQAFRVSTLVSLNALMEQVLSKTALLIAQKSRVDSLDRAFEKHLRRLATEHYSLEAERRLYARIIRHSSLLSVFKPPRLSDFTPRLRVSPLLHNSQATATV